jgi:sarcosine oxidase subunit delta
MPVAWQSQFHGIPRQIPSHFEVSFMLLITCPYCGPRAESEFSYGGEAHIARPLDTDALTDEQWGEYLFMRKNPKGLHREQWLHAAGCRRWFNAERNTVSYVFSKFYKVGENPDAPAAHPSQTTPSVEQGGQA